MQKFFLIFLCICCLYFTSCEKRKVTRIPIQACSGSLIPVYGTMVSTQYLNYHPSLSLVDTNYSAKAWFFPDPQCNCMISNFSATVPVVNVYLDSTRLQVVNTFAGGQPFYIDSTFQLKLRAVNSWHVDGAGNIPTLSFNFNTHWPAYTGYQQLPDTISRTQDNLVTLANISGADSVCITVNDNSNLTGHSFTTGTVKPDSSFTITIPMSKVSIMNNTSHGTLTVSLFKFTPVQTVSGKNFIFVKDVEFNQTIEIDNY